MHVHWIVANAIVSHLTLGIYPTFFVGSSFSFSLDLATTPCSNNHLVLIFIRQGLLGGGGNGYWI